MKEKYSLTTGCLLTTLGVSAQNTAVGTSSGMSDPLLWIIYLIAGLLLLVTYVLYLISRELKRYANGELETEEGKMWDNRSSWEKIFQLKPVGTDKDSLINEPHDGIYELDNPPPPWFMFFFYTCVAFAVIYFVRFSISDYGYTQEEEYIAATQAAEARLQTTVSGEDLNIDENNVVVSTDAITIAAGKKVYVQNCKVCHADGGKGLTGPNLTDEYWKHGGGAKNIFKTIKYGVIEKGMASWKESLNPKKMQEVTSYILSLQGTNPVDGKEPEGNKWIPEEEESVETPDSTKQNLAAD